MSPKQLDQTQTWPAKSPQKSIQTALPKEHKATINITLQNNILPPTKPSNAWMQSPL
jgi:hypothetical protein